MSSFRSPDVHSDVQPISESDVHSDDQMFRCSLRWSVDQMFTHPHTRAVQWNVLTSAPDFGIISEFRVSGNFLSACMPFQKFKEHGFNLVPMAWKPEFGSQVIALTAILLRSNCELLRNLTSSIIHCHLCCHHGSRNCMASSYPQSTKMDFF